jgi:hypothetical protein
MQPSAERRKDGRGKRRDDWRNWDEFQGKTESVD